MRNLTLAIALLTAACGNSAGNTPAAVPDAVTDAGNVSAADTQADTAASGDTASKADAVPSADTAPSADTDAIAVAADAQVPADAPATDSGPTGSDVVQPKACTTNSGCAAHEYCKGSGCTGGGQCADKPQVCTAEYAPVCGCDGKTYSNACGAAGAGTNVAASGECSKPTGTGKWYETCGAPVCGNFPLDPSIGKCSGEKSGDPCANKDAKCDAGLPCSAYLVCADSDPKLNGCPKSRAALKSDIRYVDAAQLRGLSDRLLRQQLATYRYTAKGPQSRRHLGFIIDDDPTSPAVDPERDMVDLYGYLSMAVATLQTQQREIQALKAEVAALRGRRR